MTIAYISFSSYVHVFIASIRLMSVLQIPFSIAPATNRVFAGLLGAVNLFGALYLGNVLSTYSALYPNGLPGILGLSQSLYLPLVIYAIGFNAIPALRYFWLKQQNEDITGRNTRRQLWARILDRAVGPLYQKIATARRFKQDLKVIKQGDVTYSTSKSLSEQPNEELKRFDKKLKGDGRN